MARVCLGDVELASGTAQAPAFHQIEDYVRMGPSLAVLCCFLWFPGIAKGADAAMQLIVAVFRQWGPTTRISEGHHAKALSTARSLWLQGVQVLLIVVALRLGLGGVQLLCRTSSVERMLCKLVCSHGTGRSSEQPAGCRYKSCVHTYSRH